MLTMSGSSAKRATRVNDLRLQAERYRYLATSVGDEHAREVLKTMSREIDEEAARLEKAPQASPAPPRHRPVKRSS
jgi:hypothetical protein